MRGYEPEVAEALTNMFVSGTSTHRVGHVAEKLLGVAPSASAVSRLNQALTEQYEAWRERRLLAHYRIIYLDGIHFTVRHGTQTDATMIVTALGSIWRAAEKCWPFVPVPRKTRMVGVVCFKICGIVG